MKPKLSIKAGQTNQLKKRSHVRFEPDPNTIASIDTTGGDTFKPSIVGLVLNESFKGCGLITANTPLLQVGDKCVVQVGGLTPMRAEVKWRTEIDSQAIKLGLMFLD